MPERDRIPVMVHVERAMRAYMAHFHVSRARAVADLIGVMLIGPPRRMAAATAAALTADGFEDNPPFGLSCLLCQDAEFWVNEYGIFAEAARWYWCGPFGIDCQYE